MDKELCDKNGKPLDSLAARSAWVEDTWELFGDRIQALNDVVWVRTDPPELVLKSGLIIPRSHAGFFSGLPKGIVISAIVTAAGPETSVSPGDRVWFLRLDFAWMHRFYHDTTYLGYAREGLDTLMLCDPPHEEEKDVEVEADGGNWPFPGLEPPTVEEAKSEAP